MRSCAVHGVSHARWILQRRCTWYTRGMKNGGASIHAPPFSLSGAFWCLPGDAERHSVHDLPHGVEGGPVIGDEAAVGRIREIDAPFVVAVRGHDVHAGRELVPRAVGGVGVVARLAPHAEPDD